jgi:hypothetical protein
LFGRVVRSCNEMNMPWMGQHERLAGAQLRHIDRAQRFPLRMIMRTVDK